MKIRPRSVLLALASVLGLATGHTRAAITAPVATAQQQQLAVKNGGAKTDTREIKDDGVGYGSSIALGAFRGGGHTPKEWGMSRACAKMVRKNRLHAKGLKHAKI